MTRPPPGTRVLVVEDEPIIAMSAEDMIETIDCVVAACAATPAEALALVDRARFDVALLDINLNGETSFGVADRLLEMARPFVFASGYGEAILPTRHAGARMINKPYRLEDLAAALARSLEG